MPRATCRCGEILTFPAEGAERIVCPRCSARVRVRLASPRANGDGDGFARFACPCGRRLKVRVEPGMPDAGMCPDCGRVVPVPATATHPEAGQSLPADHPEAITDELSTADLAMLERWKQGRQGEGGRTPPPTPPGSTVTVPFPAAVPPTPNPVGLKTEAGIRICPRCGKPVHLSSITCRECGAHVPKR